MLTYIDPLTVACYILHVHRRTIQISRQKSFEARPESHTCNLQNHVSSTSKHKPSIQISKCSWLPYFVGMHTKVLQSQPQSYFDCRMEDLQKRLGDLLQGTAKKGLKMSVTQCILAEFLSLGADFQGTPTSCHSSGASFCIINV